MPVKRNTRFGLLKAKLHYHLGHIYLSLSSTYSFVIYASSFVFSFVQRWLLLYLPLADLLLIALDFVILLILS